MAIFSQSLTPSAHFTPLPPAALAWTFQKLFSDQFMTSFSQSLTPFAPAGCHLHQQWNLDQRIGCHHLTIFDNTISKIRLKSSEEPIKLGHLMIDQPWLTMFDNTISKIRIKSSGGPINLDHLMIDQPWFVRHGCLTIGDNGWQWVTMHDT